MKRARVRVTGLVQGVYFRAEMRDRARSLRVAGWTRNAPDGAVEAVFEGEDERVDSLVEWCRRGPVGARVESIAVEWADPTGEGRFRIVG